MKDDKKPLPHDVITEMMGQAQFSNNEELDLSIAEQIGGMDFTSMKVLIDTISEEIRIPKHRSNFMAFTRTFESSIFYGPYMKSNP